MRTDMHKVIVERPRRGSRLPNCKTALRLSPKRIAEAVEDGEDHDGGPRRLRAQPRDKELNEHLGPLRRYLRSQTGRPWDKVYSDIRGRIDTRSALGLHVLQHLRQYVEVRTFLVDRKVYTYDWFQKPVPVDGFYVHPKSGLLCWKPRRY